jgi:hypothetical protein
VGALTGGWMRLATMVFGLLVMVTVQGAPSTKATSSRCDRSCLEGIADRYLDALVARNPTLAPLSGHVRFTENGQVLKIGDALWATAQKLGAYRVVVADVQDGTIGLFQVMNEAGQPILLAARLSVVDRQITEIEAIVSRSEPGGASNPEALTRQPAFFDAVPEGERVSTTQLRNIANSYFEGLVQATDKLTPFDEHCFRIENGSRTANNQLAPQENAALDCRGQSATGLSRYITDLRERRFPVVDEERGLVFAQVFLDHAGTVPAAADDGTVARAPFNRPYSFEIFELFKVDDGRIKQIEAVLVPVPYGMPSNWSPVAAEPRVMPRRRAR